MFTYLPESNFSDVCKNKTEEKKEAPQELDNSINKYYYLYCENFPPKMFYAKGTKENLTKYAFYNRIKVDPNRPIEVEIIDVDQWSKNIEILERVTARKNLEKALEELSKKYFEAEKNLHEISLKKVELTLKLQNLK